MLIVSALRAADLWEYNPTSRLDLGRDPPPLRSGALIYLAYHYLLYLRTSYNTWALPCSQD